MHVTMPQIPVDKSYISCGVLSTQNVTVSKYNLLVRRLAMLCKISKQFTLHPAAVLACELHILEVLEGSDVVATGVG